MNEKINNSYLISSTEGSSSFLRACTPLCPFDAKNLPHPQFIYPSIHSTDRKENGIITNSDACCLSKLQVDCRIQCHKRKKKYDKMKKNKRYNSRHSSQSTKQSISSSSSSSQLSPNQKRKKFDSNTNVNSHYTYDYDCHTQTSSSSYLISSNTSESDIAERSYSSNKSKSMISDSYVL